MRVSSVLSLSRQPPKPSVPLYKRLLSMPKHTLADHTPDASSSNKRPRMASPAPFAPIKVASRGNSDAADADTPFQKLTTAMNQPMANPVKGDCVVFWMRMADLRIKDNRGLSHASEKARKEGIPLVVLFVISPQDYHAHDRGARKIDFTLRNLGSLKRSLSELHIPLHTVTVNKRKAVVPDVLSFLDSLACNHIFGNIEYEIDELLRDIELLQLGKKSNKRVSLFHNKSVVEPGIIRSKGGGKAYAVYSPYQNHWIQIVNKDISVYLSDSKVPEANDRSVRDCPKLGPLFNTPVPTFVEGFELDDDDATTMKDIWPEGEETAAEVLQRFLQTKARSSQLGVKGPLTDGAVHDNKNNRISKYHTSRDQVDKDTTSRLSPYLSSGIISVREVIRTIMRSIGSTKIDNNPKTGAGRFIQELAWRDFYTDVLASFPRVSMGRPFLEKYSEVVWENHQAPGDTSLGQPGHDGEDSEALRRWKEGTTGVPVVDAAMRCLNKIGWVHNRMRMIVAMYLAKHLMIDWRVGERYFMQNLIDGDLASNNGGWQWSASTGVDPCPYFRIFNPYNQSTKADPAGEFIRHWVPELAKVRGPELHDPPSSVANKLGYPLPTIEHKHARERVLRRYKYPDN